MHRSAGDTPPTAATPATWPFGLPVYEYMADRPDPVLELDTLASSVILTFGAWPGWPLWCELKRPASCGWYG